MHQDEMTKKTLEAMDKAKNHPGLQAALKENENYIKEILNGPDGAKIKPLQDFATIMQAARKEAALLQMNGLLKAAAEEKQWANEFIGSLLQELDAE
jgi:hypothetical protein